MYKAFKYRLKPNKEQEQQLISFVGASRWIWNYCLDLNKQYYEKNKQFIFKYDLKVKLPKLKQEHTWLSDVPSQAITNRIIDFDTALKRVWKQGSGFPRYKSKHIEGHNTFRVDQTNKHIKPTKKQIKIPKLGWVTWKRHRPLEGKLCNITIKQENNMWWCICLCQIPDVEPLIKTTEDKIVGIDLGIKEFVITSDGEYFDTKHTYKDNQKKLAKLQRKLSKHTKGSKNRNKQRKKVNKLHYKIKNQRIDYIHKISNQITKNYDFIIVENLNISGMMKNRHLSKAIMEQGWGMFINQLCYKSMRNGGQTVKIGRFLPSSKTCSSCGNIQNMPLNVRTYECSNCGFIIDRDINAAVNIKHWGIDLLDRAGTVRINACGDTTNGEKAIDFSSYVSMKQEKFFTTGKEAVIL